MTNKNLSENEIEVDKIKQEAEKPEMHIDEQINILASIIIEILLNELT